MSLLNSNSSKIDINNDELNLENVYYYEELFLKINQELKEKNLLTLQNELENPLSSVLMKMEYQGIRLDSNLISEIKEIFENEIQKLETEIFRVSGVEFNIASPKQLGEILFERLSLESNPKKLKPGNIRHLRIHSQNLLKNMRLLN